MPSARIRSRFRGIIGRVAAVAGLFAVLTGPASANPLLWTKEFPATDFSKRSIKFTEIRSDGATKDSIPPIVAPEFERAGEIKGIGALEPVLSFEINGDLRAYPLRILLWHEIVNDVVGGVPVVISYCPLCNSGVVFDRRISERTLVFGNTGRLRHFDMLMYDHNTESWWQQFLGEAVIGELTGMRMKPLASRIESFELFAGASPHAKVLVPTHKSARAYGTTPYVRMDSRKDAAARFPYQIPDGMRPLERVIIVEGQAWPLSRLREEGRIDSGDLVLAWSPGQNSIHDTRWIHFGRDVGNVSVQKRTEQGLRDVIYDMAFAYAFAAFHPEGTWHRKEAPAEPKTEDN